MDIKNLQSFNYKARGKNINFKSNINSVFDQFNTNYLPSSINASIDQSSQVINPQKPIQQLSQSIPSGKTNKSQSKRIIAIVISALAIAGGVIGLISSRKKPPPMDKALELLKTGYSKIIEKFPEDKYYYEKLANEIGLKKGEEYKLSSIVGAKQLEHLLDTFTPQDFKVGKNFEGVKDYTYRVNLHNHTIDSDGTLSVNEILEHAKKLADKIAEKVKDNKPAFTLAITDHDSLDGAKEAVKIIAEDPTKFKNLRVVLGSEFSLVHTNPNDVKVTLNYEILGYSINPFDAKLNKYLKDLKTSRINTMKKILEEANMKYPEYNYNWDEAKQCGNNLGKALTNGYIYNLRDYMAFKAGIVELGHGVSTSDAISNYGRDFIESSAFKRVDGPYLKNYLRNIGIFNDNNDITANIKPEFIEYIDKLKDSYVKNPQKLVDLNISTTSDKFFRDALDNNSDGFFGLAHPGLISLSNGEDYGKELQEYCSKKNIDWKDNLFERFLKKTLADSKGKLKATEINYQSYGQQYNGFEKYLQHIKNITSSPEHKLLNAGGVDCHANNLFREKVQLSNKELNEIFEV